MYAALVCIEDVSTVYAILYFSFYTYFHVWLLYILFSSVMYEYWCKLCLSVYCHIWIGRVCVFVSKLLLSYCQMNNWIHLLLVHTRFCNLNVSNILYMKYFSNTQYIRIWADYFYYCDKILRWDIISNKTSSNVSLLVTLKIQKI